MNPTLEDRAIIDSLPENTGKKSDEWKTPDDFMQFFQEFDDPALSGKIDGLTREWNDPTYCNPPYSNPLPWVKKAIQEADNGKRVIMLLRHDSSTEWWRLLHEHGAYFLAVIGRLHFSGGGPANFASVLIMLPAKKSIQTSSEELDALIFDHERGQK
jgi:hypothetical protein